MLETILPIILEQLPLIITGIGSLVISLFYKNDKDKKDKQDALASLETGVAQFLRENPKLKNVLADGKITDTEWQLVFNKVGPIASSIAVKGGAKVLKRWTGPVANKYIEVIAREVAEQFKDKTVQL